MVSRLAMRFVTGPLGFLVAGAVDVSILWGQWGARTLGAKLAGRLAR